MVSGSVVKDGITTNNSWFDRLATPLNACSLETYSRIPTSSPGTVDADVTVDNEPHPSTSSAIIPLVIGCYQLNEPSSSNTNRADSDNSVANSNSEEDDADEKDDGSCELAKSSRSGELRLFMIGPSSAPSKSDANNHDPVQTDNQSTPPLKFGEPSDVIEMESGVLDGKWRRRVIDHDAKNNARSPLFASACASGRIHIHSLCSKSIDELDSQNRSWSLSHVASSEEPPAEDSTALCLALAWNDYLNIGCDSSSNASDQIVSSYSNGTVALHEVISSKNDSNGKHNLEIRETQRWNAHTMFGCPSEVWTCSFLRGVEHVVMSGADDCSLKIWDVRQTQRPTHKIGDTEFEAGVTAISSHPSLSHIFAVGSYDEHVRIYDHRKMDEPLWKVSVGGGVWRIKWHPSCWENFTTSNDVISVDDNAKSSYNGKLLVAAMHGGCRVLDIPGLNSYSSTAATDGTSDVDILSKFTAHESMAYGSDWIWFGQSCKDAVASCSFYDRQAFIWDPYQE